MEEKGRERSGRRREKGEREEERGGWGERENENIPGLEKGIKSKRSLREGKLQGIK